MGTLKSIPAPMPQGREAADLLVKIIRDLMVETGRPWGHWKLDKGNDHGMTMWDRLKARPDVQQTLVRLRSKNNDRGIWEALHVNAFVWFSDEEDRKDKPDAVIGEKEWPRNQWVYWPLDLVEGTGKARPKN